MHSTSNTDVQQGLAARWPTAIDLFSGAGGLTDGLRRARFRVVGAVECDHLAAATYRLNFPNVPLWEDDIRNLDPLDVAESAGLRAGELSLLAGCPPCQGFSTVRTRRKTTVRDDRNALIDDYVRFAVALRPTYLLMENVPGLSRYSRFRSACSRLRSAGYELAWTVHDAADFGVPQRRKRLILIGSRAGRPTLPSPGAHRRITVRDAIGHLAQPGSTGDPLHDLEEKRSGRIAALIHRIPVDGGSRSALGADQLECHKRTNGFKDVYGRMAWDDVAPTITGGCVNPSKGRFLHPEQHRAITLREALLLQGMGPGFKLSLGDGKFAAAQMVGNAIPPPLVTAHALAIRDLMRQPGAA